MDHWIFKVWPWISRLGHLLIAALGGTAAVSPFLRNEPLGLLAFHAIGGIAFALLASYYFLRLGDYILERSASAQLGRAFANALEDRRSVGVEEMTTEQAASLWFDLDPSARNTTIGNTRFRWIKSAVDLGYVAGAPLNENGRANRNTVVVVSELAEFFSRRDWRKVVAGSAGR